MLLLVFHCCSCHHWPFEAENLSGDKAEKEHSVADSETLDKEHSLQTICLFSSRLHLTRFTFYFLFSVHLF